MKHLFAGQLFFSACATLAFIYPGYRADRVNPEPLPEYSVPALTPVPPVEAPSGELESKAGKKIGKQLELTRKRLEIFRRALETEGTEDRP